MDISGVSSVAASANGSIATKAIQETQDIQKEAAQTLIESLPDPESSLGQNINVKA